MRSLLALALWILAGITLAEGTPGHVLGDPSTERRGFRSYVVLPLASAVAEFGLLLRSGSHDAALWDGLSRRIARLQVPSHLSSDVDGFRELVAIASGLERIR